MKNRIFTIGFILLIMVFGFLTFSSVFSRANAEPPRPQQVLDSVNGIISNQERIAELRPSIEEFDRLKTDNAVLVGRLQGWGYVFDWSTLTATREINAANPLQ
jgi:hypothetical protein